LQRFSGCRDAALSAIRSVVSIVSRPGITIRSKCENLRIARRAEILPGSPADLDIDAQGKFSPSASRDAFDGSPAAESLSTLFAIGIPD
jgi:hypothetical protein